MKKLLTAAFAAALVAMAAQPAGAQITTYTDVTGTGDRISVPVTPAKPLPSVDAALLAAMNSPAPPPDASPFLNMSTATTTKIISAVNGKRTLITLWRYRSAGVTNHKLVSGTGTNCGTGTADLTETVGLTAQDGAAIGNGLGVIILVAAGLDVCSYSSQAVTLSVGLAFNQIV